MRGKLGSLVLSAAISTVSTLWAGCGATAKKRFVPEDRVAITTLLSDQQQAWNRGDIESFMQGYVHTSQLVFTSGSKIRRGWQDTYERYRARYGGDSSTMGQLSFEVLEIQSLGADGAVVLGRWKLSGLSAPAGGVFSVILERQPEGWRIVHDHTSSNSE